MASPMPMPPMGSWNAGGQAPPPPQAQGDEFGPQIRLMGLKVHYSFDKENQVNCLAKLPQTLQVQTVPISETARIGIIDLRVCIQAVASCSPELLNQIELDYSVYAVDYSEPENPLVGQGVLSWILDPRHGDQSADQMVTGRVTRNMLAMFGKGSAETLEVKLRLTPTKKMQRPGLPSQAPQAQPSQLPQQPQQLVTNMETQQTRPADAVMTPSGVAEWNAFIQSNPQLSRVQSPAIPLAPIRPEPTRPGQRRDSLAVEQKDATELPRLPQPSDEPRRIAPTPVDSADAPAPAKAPSRPSSRAGRKRGVPTGRPRGRPRKNAIASEGNLSGYEDATEAEDSQNKADEASQKKQVAEEPASEKADEEDTDEDVPLAAKRNNAKTPRDDDATEPEDGMPPKKKRATTKKVTKSNNANHFGSGPESLRVAASTSGSIRNFRPIAASTDASAGTSHLQEMPRAPTPVPEIPAANNRKKAGEGKGRKRSAMAQEITSVPPPTHTDATTALSPGQEDHSPQKPVASTPNYPEDSPADIGSSPPVPRSTQFMRSSPPPSSPILPPMPQPDSGFMSGGVEDLFEESNVMEAEQQPKPARRSTKSRGIPNGSIQVFKLAELNKVAGQEPVLFTSFSANTANKSTPQALATPPIAPHLHRSATEPGLPHPLSVPSPGPLMMTEASPQPVDISATTAASDLPEYTGQTFAPMPQPFPEPGLEMGDHEAGVDHPNQTNLPTLMPAAIAVPPRPNTARPQRPLGRSASMGPLALPIVPASDPVGPQVLALPVLPHATSFSEAPCPHSEAAFPPSEAVPPTSPGGGNSRSNKNYVKKQSIKQRLEKAIDNGEMPPFCNNCGAIETPTWRKIWTQDRNGVPERVELSDKPGCVTAIDILAKDEEGKSTSYRLIKKALGAKDDTTKWIESLLCNPCGIWLAKRNQHRPPVRWEQDQLRLGQERRKRGTGGNGSRSRKGRAKSDGQLNPISEAWTTDPAGPGDQDSSPNEGDGENNGHSLDGQAINQGVEEQVAQLAEQANDGKPANPFHHSRSQPGSTHSRASRGTAKSPINLDLDDAQPDLGSTRRILFPSPKKDGGSPMVLGEVSINIVRTSPDLCSPKHAMLGKENLITEMVHGGHTAIDDDDMDGLFGSPHHRPSTPPPKEKAAACAPFKTPTRPTPSHRPITRSISKSIRSARSVREAFFQRTPSRTPTKTPRSRALGVPGSSILRRSPRHHPHSHGHDHHHGHFDDPHLFETPLTATINQLFPHGHHDFDTGDLLADLDMSDMPALDHSFDFGTLLSTDAPMPSSPPGIGRRVGGGVALSFDYIGTATTWAQWNAEHGVGIDDGAD